MNQENQEQEQAGQQAERRVALFADAQKPSCKKGNDATIN